MTKKRKNQSHISRNEEKTAVNPAKLKNATDLVSPKKKRKLRIDGRSNSIEKTELSKPASELVSCEGKPAFSKLQISMKRKLDGARFRMINEDLYMKHSELSFRQFSEQPELFDIYHRGFREQVEKWPIHPLDVIISWLKKYPKAIIADFGCGEARLAQSVSNSCHSFDLCSPNEFVTACDMSHVPLADLSVHIAIFCLSLMGTNIVDFLREAHRVLKCGGLLKIAEVRSRFEGSGGVEGFEEFIDIVRQLGFDSRNVDRTSKMFVLLEFKKTKREVASDICYSAKPCVYKRR